MTTTSHPLLTVAIGGLGAIGLAVARRLDEGIPGLLLVAVSARDVAGAASRMADFGRAVPVVSPAELAEKAAVVVECAPAAIFAAIAEPAIRAGRILVPASVGALLSRPDLVETAERSGARIIVHPRHPPALHVARSAGAVTIHSAPLASP